MTQFGDILYDNLAPWHFDDAAKGFPLRTFSEAMGEVFKQVETYARVDEDGNPAWSIALDVDNCPTEALPWLAQFAGVRIPTGTPDAEARDLIRNPPGFVRGTRAAIEAAAKRYLTGAKTLILLERDSSPYRLTVITRQSETPETDWIPSYQNLMKNPSAEVNSTDGGMAATNATLGRNTALSPAFGSASYQLDTFTPSQAVLDNFGSNTIANYTFSDGSGTMAISGGQVNVTSPTTDKKVIYNASTVANTRVTAKHTVGSVPSSDPRYAFQVILKHIDNNTQLWAGVTAGSATAASRRVYIGVRYIPIGETIAQESLLAWTNLATLPVAGTSYWLRASVAGNNVTAEHWLTDPALGGSANTTVSHTLASGNDTKFGSGITGKQGLGWLNGDTHDPFGNVTGVFGAAINTSSHADDFKIETFAPTLSNSGSRFAVTVGDTYSGSAYFRGTFSGTLRQVRTSLSFYNSGGTLLSTTTGTPVSESNPFEFVRASVSAVAPATAATGVLSCEILDPTDSESHLIDGLMAAKTGTLIDYFDGSLPGATWDGTANNSTSSKGTATTLVRDSILPVKPGGIVLTHTVVAGYTWAEPTHQWNQAASATWDSALTTLP